MTTIFSPAQLDAIIAETIPTLPPGHQNAIVGTVDTHGVEVAALFTLGSSGNWHVKAAGAYGWNGDASVGASIIDSW